MSTVEPGSAVSQNRRTSLAVHRAPPVFRPAKIASAVLAATSLYAWSTLPASANFTVEPTSPAPAITAPSAPLPGNGQNGPVSLLPAPDLATAWNETITGFGRPQRLSVQLAQIAPGGVTWRFDAGADGERQSSWKGSMSRRNALQAALAGTGEEASEENGGALIVVRPAAATQPLSTNVPSLPPAPTWEARSGSSLHDTLQGWCDTAGWTLDFRATDRSFIASASFDGDFTQAATRILSLYVNGREPVRAHFAGGSRVLTVWNLSDPTPPTF